MIEEKGSAALGRTLTVGAVDFHPWSLELTAHDLAIATADGRGKQLTIARVYLDAELESVLRLAPVVDAITVDAPTLQLTHLGDGHYDIDDILATLSQASASAAPSAPLPFALTWIDSRDGIFPEPPPDGAVCEHSDPVQGAVPGLAPGSRVLIMSFSHAEDLDVVAACLQRQRQQRDLPFIGLIGSQTKWATFGSRLRSRGFSQDELAQVTCPIGIPGIGGKEPEVIAVAVAAQLLLSLELA